MPATLLRYFCALLAATLVYSASSQIRPAPTLQPLRKASDLIRKQERLKINQSVLRDLTPDNARIDSAPSGTHFAGATMKWFLRLTEDGVGMHIGILPGYPASHGCIRESAEGAKLFYDHVKVGTPVDVGDY